MAIDDKQALEAESQRFIQQSLGATTVQIDQCIQRLWGDQGRIVRIRSDSQRFPSAILKQIWFNRNAHHPRGWNTTHSYERKVQSYEVECRWYTDFAKRCTPSCKVPQLLGISKQQHQRLILLEDLSEHYPHRPKQLSIKQTQRCLHWLASFHAQFMGHTGHGLWKEGSYWHLATRQDEFAAMADGPIKSAAVALDARLRNTPFQCLVHGDAKLANFCFSNDMNQIAAVDFQYVGRGCGMKDVIYLLGSCLSEHDCATFEDDLLDCYFEQLDRALISTLGVSERSALISQWRELYSIAWTDFYRFLLGWMPSHTKINSYTHQLSIRALASL